MSRSTTNRIGILAGLLAASQSFGEWAQFTDPFNNGLATGWYADLPLATTSYSLSLPAGGDRGGLTLVSQGRMAWTSDGVYGARRYAPILWRAAPAGSYSAETCLRELDPALDQMAGIVIYEGPDGGRAVMTTGLRYWRGSGSHAFEQMNDWRDHTLIQLDRSRPWVFLRLQKTEEGATDTYAFWYRQQTSEDWKPLATRKYSGAGARIGLFLGTPYSDRAAAEFDYFTVTKETPAGQVVPDPITPRFLQMAKDNVTLYKLRDGTYGEVFLDGIEGSSGCIRLTRMAIAGGQIRSLGGGELRYIGPLSRCLGNTFAIRSGWSDDSGLHLNVENRLAPFLGASEGTLEFLVNRDSAVIPIAARLDWTSTSTREAVTFSNAFLQISPEQDQVTGGMSVTLGTGSAVPAVLEVLAVADPNEPRRTNMEVTAIRLDAEGLARSIGTSGGLLQRIKASIENPKGLTTMPEWGKANLVGEFDIVLGEAHVKDGATKYPFAFSGSGVWSIHDGSFDFGGTGSLLGAIPLTDTRLRFTPSSSLAGTGRFDAGDFSGSVSFGQQAGGPVTGTLSGAFRIPSRVPLVGGKTVGQAVGTLKGQRMDGEFSIELTPAIPELCVPEKCIPDCFKLYLCDWCQKCGSVLGVELCSPPYPCNCGLRDACSPIPLCTPGFCTPAIDAVKLRMRFEFTMDDASFEFDRIGKPVVGDAFTFATNWQVLPASSGELPPSGSTLQEIGPNQSFTLTTPVPSIGFRVLPASGVPSPLPAILVTPSHDSLSSADGALPLGYPGRLGFSTFNPETGERAIVLIRPELGTYMLISGANSPDEAAEEAIVQDAPPAGRITSVQPGPGATQFTVNWEEVDGPGVNAVRISLDTGREAGGGHVVESLEPSANTGSYTFDAGGLDIPAGAYFVSVLLDDRVNAPVRCVSEALIDVVPTNRPAPPTEVRYVPLDGGFRISWTASASTGVIGYLVQWGIDSAAWGGFANQAWIAADEVAAAESPLPGTEIGGLANGVAVLVQVVSVGADLARSRPSEVLRITPRKRDANHAPQIVSLPDTDATAGYAYVYAPLYKDVDYSQQYAWSLADGPAGMFIDPTSGLVQWTPSPDEIGDYDVLLVLTETASDASTATAMQSYRIHVSPPDQIEGIEPHLYRFISQPQNITAAGEDYTYQPVVSGPDTSVRFALRAGPPGMAIDLATGLVTWSVPADAQGAWVLLRATSASEQSTDQEYYLAVHRDGQILPAEEEAAGEDLTWAPVCGTLCGAGALPWMCITGLSLLSLKRGRRATA